MQLPELTLEQLDYLLGDESDELRRHYWRCCVLLRDLDYFLAELTLGKWEEGFVDVGRSLVRGAPLL